MADTNLNVAVGDAVDRAKDAFDAEPNNPLDHGFAHMEIDGRTSLASALAEHPDVDTSDWSYVTIDGVSRYLAPQRAAYRAFVDTLDEYGVETDDIDIYGTPD